MITWIGGRVGRGEGARVRRGTNKKTARMVVSSSSCLVSEDHIISYHTKVIMKNVLCPVSIWCSTWYVFKAGTYQWLHSVDRTNTMMKGQRHRPTCVLEVYVCSTRFVHASLWHARPKYHTQLVNLQERRRHSRSHSKLCRVEV